MLRRVVLIALLACVASACVKNGAYRLANPVLSEKLRTREFDRTQDPSVWELEWPYQLSFIEFDDRGELFDRRQLDLAVQTIAKAKRDAPAGVAPVVAVFVHGWKNNASDSSGNVWGFRQVLAGLALQYNRAPVVGIYIGWRGAVVSAPIVEQFTFFDRHQKSQNLPSAHFVEALLKVMQQAKGVNYDDDSTISVLVGHSFGGAVLETALTQTLEGMVVRAGSGGVRWPADLIVFLNEAQEATRSYQLIESLMANLPARDACLPPGVPQRLQHPAIVSISSTGDYATRAFFPAVQAVARPFNSLRTYPAPNPLGISSQTPMFFNTTAHLAAFASHMLGRFDDPEVAEALKGCKPYLDTTLAGIRYVMVEKPGAKNRTPYWVMHMPPTIVPDHSTIFTPVFRNFLISLLQARSQ